MLLAAGLGTRMRPLTDRTAKPLLPLGGRPLIDHALDRLAEAGVETVVVNAHWHAELIAAHLRARATRPPRTVLRWEATPLETGGGVKAALDLLGPDPFFVVNGDAYWVDGPRAALDRLAAAFDPRQVDGVLLVHRTCQVHAEVGYGDFAVEFVGRAAPARRTRSGALYLCRPPDHLPRIAGRLAGRPVQREPRVGHCNGRWATTCGCA